MPRLADVAANALDGLLLDQVAHDVRRMLAVNAFFAEHPSTGTSRAAARTARHRAPAVPAHLLRARRPERRGQIGALAEAVFRERYGGLRGLRSPDFALLSRLLGGGEAAARGELLSFIFFDEVFIEACWNWAAATPQRWLRRASRVLVGGRGGGGLRGARGLVGGGRARRVPRARRLAGNGQPESGRSSARETLVPEMAGAHRPAAGRRLDSGRRCRSHYVSRSRASKPLTGSLDALRRPARASEVAELPGSTGSGAERRRPVLAHAEAAEADELLVVAEQPQLVELPVAGRAASR